MAELVRALKAKGRGPQTMAREAVVKGWTCAPKLLKQLEAGGPSTNTR